MQVKIEDIRRGFDAAVRAAKSSAEIEELRVRYLGRKGPVQDLMKDLKNVPDSERPDAGKRINDLKKELTERLDQSLRSFAQMEQLQRLKEEVVDVTLPGRRRYLGNSHVVNSEMDRIIEVLVEMGFSVQEGPEVESEYYNFEVLNFAADHPARDMQDTFYVSDKMLLRTQTTNIQARVMQANRPPIRIVCPGRVYRNEAVTARSHVFFHQVDGFYVDKHVSFSHLFATLDEFLHKLLGADVEIRSRPAYFPFVEPGLEVDIRCSLCGGAGCSMCKNTGWVEVLGAGMIHPEVLRNCGIDPEVYSGYAWGMGVERMVNIKYGVTDIRLFTENDLRFLSQFRAL